MSYADRIREELIALPAKRPCCRRALAYGLLTGVCAEEGQALSFPTEALATFAAQALQRQFGKKNTVEKATVNRHVSYGFSVCAQAQKAIADLRAQQWEADTDVEQVLSLSCEGCRSAFLRGAFLVGATVNDPRKSFHLEFVTPSVSEGILTAFLSFAGYEPRRMERAKGVGLYYKSSTAVEELVTLMGAARSAMEIINIRIEREIRNQENRATNCVAKNIEKSVSAASRQMAAIEKLTLSGMLAQLPEGIRHTALLRAENPDATLEELRMLHEPPITKSGLNHRLQKILDAADKI